ncbi:MAG: TlpA family protein disulfide reductase [Clostridia bacterium]|nr:TlpA family protein disulfide reductase [Clostridia bacterium]
MSKFKKIILAVLVSCFAVCAGLAVAACSNKNAVNFRKPAGFVEPGDETFNGVYNLTVQSSGGMGLNGVRVEFRKGGTTVATGISKNGIISMPLEADVYQLVVDSSSLPEGYYLDGKQYYTEVDTGNVVINIPSRVITSTAASNTVYSVGDVMYDFAFTDAVSNTKLTLSDFLNGENAYKAVMLNFFYIGCNPCRLEFPAIEEAYQAYKDKLAIIALSYQDANAAIKTFAEVTMGLSFNLGYDAAGLTSKFNVSAFPTTVIIDRFGVVATINTEGSQTAASYWRAMFNYYTNDNYNQGNINTEPDDPGEVPEEFTRPDGNKVMPSNEEINAALTGEVKGNAEIIKYYEEEGRDKEYTWPWEIKTEDNKTYITATNAEVHYSFATIYADIYLTPGDAISYEYNVITENEVDILYAFVNGSIVAQYSGNSEGWQEELAVYVANRNETVSVAFMYYKDLKTNVDNERASIRNLNIRPVSEVVDTIDQQTSIVNDLHYDAGYNHELTGGYNITVTKHDDGYYYYTPSNGKETLILADILNAGYWAEKHLGSTTFVNPQSQNTAASLYLLSFWKMSNYDRADTQAEPLKFKYLTDAMTDYLIQAYYLQGFSDNGVIPVTDSLIAVINAFINAMYADYPEMFAEGDVKYDGQWLEFCYYFVHHGAEHDLEDPDDHECYTTLDPVKGLIYENAFIAELGENSVNINKIINFGDGGGIKFKFVPDKSGVYLFRSEAETVSGIDPKLFIFDSDLNMLVESDNDMRYDSPIYNSSHDEYYEYIWLEGGQTYYVHGALYPPGSTGDFIMHIEYVGEETVSFLRYASTGDGLFTYDANGNNYYIAINVAYDSFTKCYYHYTDDFTFGSKVYIDFVHQNYFDHNGHSLYQMIDSGVFDFSRNGGLNYTSTMMTYYRQSINGKNKGDELYGLLEANQELVNILNIACQLYYEEGPSSSAWKMLACYYEYIGNPNA